jgi:hypothetical protein
LFCAITSRVLRPIDPVEPKIAIFFIYQLYKISRLLIPDFRKPLFIYLMPASYAPLLVKGPGWARIED